MQPSWQNPSTNLGDRLDFGHLGGSSTTGDHDSWYPELWTWLFDAFGVKSVLDVGCAVGQSQKFFHESGMETVGLDCEQVRPHRVVDAPFVAHDLTTAAWIAEKPFDLVWSCEVAEHIEEVYVENLINTLELNCGKVLAMTAAPPGADGYHHVNCREPEYWIRKLTAGGRLQYSESLTQEAKKLCPAAYGRGPRNYFTRSGLIFVTSQC